MSLVRDSCVFTTNFEYVSKHVFIVDFEHVFV